MSTTAAALGDSRLPGIRGSHIPVVEPLHQRAPPDSRLLEAWQGEVGFKLKGKELTQALVIWAADKGLPCLREEDGPEEAGRPSQQLAGEAPVKVHPVPRLARDVDCLLELTSALDPPRQLCRAKHVMAFFVIGDASGAGKGVAVVEQYGVDYEAGPWKMRWRKESLNVWEAENLTD